MQEISQQHAAVLPDLPEGARGPQQRTDAPRVAADDEGLAAAIRRLRSEFISLSRSFPMRLFILTAVLLATSVTGRAADLSGGPLAARVAAVEKRLDRVEKVLGIESPQATAGVRTSSVPPCNCGCMETGKCLCKNCCERTADPTWTAQPKSQAAAVAPPVAGLWDQFENQDGKPWLRNAPQFQFDAAPVCVGGNCGTSRVNYSARQSTGTGWYFGKNLGR
jgi:hypothetical protein